MSGIGQVQIGILANLDRQPGQDAIGLAIAFHQKRPVELTQGELRSMRRALRQLAAEKLIEIEGTHFATHLWRLTPHGREFLKTRFERRPIVRGRRKLAVVRMR